MGCDSGEGQGSGRGIINVGRLSRSRGGTVSAAADGREALSEVLVGEGPYCTAVLPFLRAPRRFSCGPARRAEDSSPVRQHWENDGPASEGGRGGRTAHPVPSFAPFPGLANAARRLP